MLISITHEKSKTSLSHAPMPLIQVSSPYSASKAALVSPMSEPPAPRDLGNPWYDAFHALSSYLNLDGFDVVTDHAGIVGPICGAMLKGSPPVVHTLHGPWTDQNRVLY